MILSYRRLRPIWKAVHRRFYLPPINGSGPALLSLFVLLLALAQPVLSVTAAGPANASFARTWERPDRPVSAGLASRTWMWGPEAFSAALSEPYAEAPGGSRTVQYFDKSRMEITQPGGDESADWYVTNGLLVVELVTGRVQLGDGDFDAREPALVNVAGDADDPTGPTYQTLALVLSAAGRAEGTPISERIDRLGNVTNDASLADRGVAAARFVPETQHTVAGPFWEFMNAEGVVYQDGAYVNAALFPNPFYATGFPITEAYWANVKVGGVYKDVLLQCFERRCLTYTPENAPGWQVEAGNVGQHYYAWRYGATEPTPDPDPAPEPPTQEPVVAYEYAFQWGHQADPLNKLQKPSGLARTPNDELVVVDQSTNRVMIYSQRGELVTYFETEATVPMDVEVDSDGYIWVLDYTSEALHLYNRVGTLAQPINTAVQLTQPAGFGIGPDNTLYIADSGAHRVLVVDSSGKLVRSFGSPGSGNGQFIYPTGVAVDAAGAIYVADQYNHRVQKFSAAGEFILAFGSEGSGPAQFKYPAEVKIDPAGNVWVVDFGNNQVKVFDSNGTPQGAFGGAAEMAGPMDMVHMPDGTVFVAARDDAGIHKYTNAFTHVDRWSDDSRYGITGDLASIGLDAAGNVVLTDSGGNRVLRYSKAGDYLGAVGPVLGPYGVAIDAAGNTYVTASDHKVSVYGPAGEPRFSFGDLGNGQNEFNKPRGIAIDAAGRVYVADSENHRIVVYSADGREVFGVWGEMGTGDGQFRYPTDVAIWGEYVLVTDTLNSRIQVFDLAGEFVRAWGEYGTGAGRFDAPKGIAVDAEGFVYVADEQNHRIQQFTITGAYVTQLGSFGDGPGKLDSPMDVAVTDDGGVYVADTGNSRVQVFAPQP